MKIVKFYGGLGNQMFQYAMLLAARERSGEECLMDTSVYATYGLHNGLEVNSIFNTTATEATKEQIGRLSRFTTNYKLYRLMHYLLPAKKTEFKETEFGKYYPTALERQDDCLYDGYWQHHEYFADCRDSILKEFSLREPLDEKNSLAVEEFSESDKTVSIHVRRGDIVNQKPYRGLCGLDYYKGAIEKAKEIVGEGAQFVIFSNDLEWCKEKISSMIGESPVRYVDWNRGEESYKDMVLMSACKVNIIANSSFSWWAAYLNKREDKVVIAPEKWINFKVTSPVQMPEWILI